MKQTLLLLNMMILWRYDRHFSSKWVFVRFELALIEKNGTKHLRALDHDCISLFWNISKLFHWLIWWWMISEQVFWEIGLNFWRCLVFRFSFCLPILQFSYFKKRIPENHFECLYLLFLVKLSVFCWNINCLIFYTDQQIIRKFMTYQIEFWPPNVN